MGFHLFAGLTLSNSHSRAYSAKAICSPYAIEGASARCTQIPAGLNRRQQKIKIGRTFIRKTRKALLEIIKLGKDRQERIKKGAEQLIEYAKIVLDRVPTAIRKAKPHKDPKIQEQIEAIQVQLQIDSELLERVIEQTLARYAGQHVKNKVYSLHEPQVTCIAKGKRGKPNEYGSKVSIAIDKNGFVVTHQEYDQNVGDNTTLDAAVSGGEAATGEVPKNVAADRGTICPNIQTKSTKLNALRFRELVPSSMLIQTRSTSSNYSENGHLLSL